jgi:signal recognition particle subunit SRP54
MIPGIKKAQVAMAQGGADDKMLVHFDAIMGSMTPKERAKPDIINAKRKIRIANGSGTTVQQVNKVLKMHQEMASAMKKIRKMGGLKGLGALFGRGGGIPGMPGLGGGGMGGGGLPGLGGGSIPPELANLMNKKK